MFKYLLAIGCLVLMPAVFAQELGEELNKDGVDLGTPEGGLNLRIVDGSFRAYFFDEDRLVIDPPYAQAIIFTEEVRRPSQNDRLFLTRAGERPFLTGPRNIPVPYDYWIRVVLHSPIEEVEDFTVPRTRFRQELPDDVEPVVEPEVTY